MNRVALNMLTGDRAKFIGILVGLTFASLLITQQSAIYDGLLDAAMPRSATSAWRTSG